MNVNFKGEQFARGFLSFIIFVNWVRVEWGGKDLSCLDTKTSLNLNVNVQ